MEEGNEPDPDADKVDTGFWTKLKAVDLQEELLDTSSQLHRSKKPQIEQLKVMQKSRHVLLNKRAATVLGEKDVKLDREL